MPRLPRSAPHLGAVTDRTRRLADVLRAHGLGCRRERRALAGWESARTTSRSISTTATSISRACSARSRRAASPFNVNYRYVEEELLYLFDNARRARGDLPRALRADARAHPRAASRRSRSGSRSPTTRGEPLLPGALDYEAALAARRPDAAAGPLARRSLHPLHRRHDGHAEGRALAAGGHLPRRALRGAPRDVDAREIVARAQGPRRCARCPRRPSCTAPRTGWRSASGTRAARSWCSRSRAASIPHDIWSTVERERVDRADDRGRRLRAAAARSARARGATTSRRCSCSPRAARSSRADAQAGASSERLPRPAHPRRARLVRERRAGVAVSRRRRQRVDRRLRARAPAARGAERGPLGRRSRPASTRARLARAPRARAARLLQGRGEDGAHLPGGRRRALRGARRSRDARGATARMRLLGRDSGHDQHRRREGLRRGGRARAQASTPPCTTRWWSARRTSAADSR